MYIKIQIDKQLSQAWEWIRQNQDAELAQKGLKMLEALAHQYPERIQTHFEYAGALDYLGHEQLAAQSYEKVLEMGVEDLPLKQRPEFYVQYGSTLRNLRLYAKAHLILDQGMQKYPEYMALKAFKALLRISEGDQPHTHLRWLKILVEESRDSSILRFERSLRNYIKIEQDNL
ncbi:MAG: tetratricopeptide repeat protein [Bdellovibrionota bacterium]